MAWLNLDIRSLLVLLVFGNLVSVCLMAFTSGYGTIRRLHGIFIAGKLLQGVSWTLLSLRGQIPDLLSAHLGNSLLIAGFAGEAAAFAIVSAEDHRWDYVFLMLGISGAAGFWLLGSDPRHWVPVASLAALAIYGTASVCLFRDSNPSRLRLLLAGFFGVFSLILAIRAWVAMQAHGGLLLMSQHLVQTMSFLSLFILMIASAIGFPLMLKERKDRLLQESETKFSTLFHASPDALLLTMLDDGRILDVNARFEKLTGYLRTEAIGRTIGALGLFLDAPARGGLLRLLRAEGRIRDEEIRFRTQSGASIVGLVSAETIPLQGHDVVLSCVTDITDRKQLEQERDRTIAELKLALADIKTLSGLLPICSSCKKIRDDKGYWNQIEQYISEHSQAAFTHGLCPECAERLYPDFYDPNDFPEDTHSG